MPGFFIDLDEYFLGKLEKANYFKKFPLANLKCMQTQKKSIIQKHSKNFSQFLKLVLENLRINSGLFFKDYSDELLQKKQIHFDWFNFNMNYFLRFNKVSGRKKKFYYNKRIAQGLMTKREKLKTYDWSKKTPDFLELIMTN